MDKQLAYTVIMHVYNFFNRMLYDSFRDMTDSRYEFCNGGFYKMSERFHGS